jgi:SAM-dependent methyltransferase
MKLHLGCGRVYLRGYVNIDGSADYLADRCPQHILESVATDPEEYYKCGFNKGAPYVVVDRTCELSQPLPYGSGVVETVRMEQVLEHFPSYMVGHLFNEVHRVLEPKGVLVVGVPDVKETARMLVEAETPEDEDWSIRLLYGTQRNTYSHHYCGYVQRTLKALLKKHGFGQFEELPNINCYPVIRLRAVKEV